MLQFVEAPAKRRLAQLTWPVIWFGVTVVGAWLKPNAAGHGTHRQLGLPQCPSVAFFGRPCPGCGLTTSWTNLIHGHIYESFMSNLLGPVLYLAFTGMAFVSLVAYLRGKYWDTNTPRFNWVASLVLGAFLIYGGLRFATTKYSDVRPVVEILSPAQRATVTR
jgi:hypothetical protein